MSAAAAADNNKEITASVSKSANAFAGALYQVLRSEPGNLFCSPISVHAVLSLLFQGAAGATADELRTGLRLGGDQRAAATGYDGIMSAMNAVRGVSLHMANKVYVAEQCRLAQVFRDTAVKQFHAEAEPVNFSANTEAAQLINDWVESKTNNRIKDLISPNDLDSLTRIVLVNAIYFKGTWAKQFDKASTRKEPFWVSATESVDCDMMHKKAKFPYREIPELDAKALQLSYENDSSVSMVFLLPNQRDGIVALEDKLRDYDLGEVTKYMRNVEVTLSLPKFKVETTMDLGDTLKKLGMENMFTADAELTGLLDNKEQLVVSKAIQKAFIEVNEEGAEAAAATGVILMTRSMPIRPVTFDFIADHPFIFMLVNEEDSRSVQMFLGRFSLPA